MKFLICLFLFIPCNTNAQNTVGLPSIDNYGKAIYNAGLQNWDVKQDKNGIVYIANNEGLLSFDGTYWNLYPLPNKTIVRSVEIGSDNRIYAGGQDEFGYFSPSSNGKLSFTSLVSFIPEKDRSFADVWDIASYKNDIFFRTTTRIFRISGQVATVYPALSEWTYLNTCNGKLFAHDNVQGLSIFTNNTWQPMYPGKLGNLEVTAMVHLKNDTTVITTLKNGIFLLTQQEVSRITSPDLNILGQDRINTAAAVNNEWIALATTKNGVNIIDLKGHLIQSFSKREGIQNNNVLSVFLDNQGNLWLGLDNGIDCIAINSAIKLLNPNSQDASIYTARIFNNRLYAGTSSGLYSVELQQIPDLSYSKGSFVPVANASGQAWGLSEINGKLLLAHHEGAYEVSDNSATRITPYLGFWNFVPMSSVFPTASIVSGTYKGLSFLDYRNNHFTESFKVPGFSETSRFVALDRFNNIWVSHPYHGVYKVTRTDGNNFTTKLYTQSNGLPSSLNNHVFKIKGDVLVASEKGIYTYNTEKDNFEYSPLYGELFGKQSLRYLKEDEDGNIWFIHEKNVGIADMSAHPPKLIYLPELNRKMLSGFEFIYPVDSKNIFMGGEKGLFHINYDQYKKNSRDIIVQLRSVKITDNLDSLLFGGYFWNVNEIQQQGKNQVPNIENRWKTIHFEFSSPEFGQKANLEYSFRLEGFNDKWSDWSGKTEKEYTNLPGGNYQFEIKARNNLGKESGVYAYAFIFQPPWYQTTWAYFIYTIIFIISVYLIYRAQRKKFLRQQIKYEQEQKNFLYLHQLEINKAESELVTLRNEKLQAEIDYKNSELANSAMHLVHKGELLTKLKTELSQTMKMIDNNEGKTEMKKMIKVLTEDDKMDKDWEDFAQHFDKVHSDFIVGLKEQFPKLTSNELKLSAYLRMNLSTKKIAQLMSISVRGVEISRYRLRKKLEIPTGASLFDFLMQLRF